MSEPVLWVVEGQWGDGYGGKLRWEMAPQKAVFYSRSTARDEARDLRRTNAYGTQRYRVTAYVPRRKR